MSRISKVRNNNQAPGLQGAYFKLTLLQKIMLVFGVLIAIFTTLPVMVVLLIGLLPTFTIMVTDRKTPTN